MSLCYFVSGTDTDVGKTFVASALLARAGQLGLRTAGFKPVAAGAQSTAEGLRNGDALELMAAANQVLPYNAVNPYCFEAAIAPHIAAAEQGVEVSVDTLLKAMERFRATAVDFSLVEGAGGWRVPLNSQQSFADFAVALNVPVIMVVAMRLGCINHAVLTAEAIAGDGLPLAGWVANQAVAAVMPHYRDNVRTLQALLPAPLLGEIPYCPQKNIKEVAERLRLPREVGATAKPL
ncbi:MAG: dethiobiotin synthase [Porticoccaceae bacterium]